MKAKVIEEKGVYYRKEFDSKGNSKGVVGPFNTESEAKGGKVKVAKADDNSFDVAKAKKADLIAYAEEKGIDLGKAKLVSEIRKVIQRG